MIGPRGLFGCEGGIEKFTDEFIPRVLQHANADVLCIIKPDCALPPGLQIITVPSSKKFKTDKALYLIYALGCYAARRYDHVFIFGTNFAILVPFLRAIFWRRAKIHLRSGSIDHIQKKWGGIVGALLKITEKFCRYADTVIAVSPSIQKHLTRLGINSILVRNGLNRESHKNALFERTPNTIVAVGRITVPKNYAVLIEASALLGAQGPSISIIGGADLSGEAEKLTALYGKNEHIHFMGVQKRDSVMLALRKSSLYVNCSVHEGMSNAVLEAIQQGIPVILSDIEANRDLGLNERFYFPPHDGPRLAAKIREALTAPLDYTVPAAQFEDWDSAIETILKKTGVAP